MAEFIAGRGTQALSIIGTVLGGLATLGEGMGVLNGSNNYNSNITYATKTDVDNAILLANKDSEISLLKANAESERKMIDIFERLSTNINNMKTEQSAWNTQQLLNNCQMSSAIAVCQSSVSGLQDMTKTVIPITNVCPTPAVASTSSSSGSGSGTGTT